MYTIKTIAQIALLLSLALVTDVNSQVYNQKDRKRISSLIYTLDTYHLKADELLPKVKDRIAHLFILEVESSFRSFTHEDLNELEKSFSKFDESPTQAALQFLEKSHDIYQKRLALREKFINNSHHHIHWKKSDTIHLYSRHSFSYYPKNESALLEGWIKNLKYETLLTNEEKNTSATHLSEVMNELLEIERCKLQQYQNPQKGLKEELLTKFLKAYAKSFDPHSDYFDEESMALFNSSLSSDMYSTGVYANFQSEKFIISYVEPTSKARNNHNIEEGDEITFIKCGNISGHPYCLSSEEIETCFFSPDHKDLQLTVKSKKTNQSIDISLRKEVSKNLYNGIFSATMSSNGVHVGYLSFPTFYLQQSNFDSSVSQDLARIILQMKAKKIQGLIIDLRNNGGGSVEEAIDLSGFFIDYGPLFWSESSFNELPSLNKDYNKGLLYDDKIMVMTNYATASASEMFLSAMKQYGRVLHVGSTTFGKASGQIMVALESVDNPIPFGYLKVTTLSVQMLDGHSYQQIGLTPDISLPDIGFGFLYRENNQPYALSNVSIQNNALPKKPQKILLSDQMVANHLQRMSENTALRHITSLQDSLKKFSVDKMPVVLNMHSDFSNSIDFEKMINQIAFDITPLDDSQLHKQTSKELTKDPILYESLLIFEDWINEN